VVSTYRFDHARERRRRVVVSGGSAAAARRDQADVVDVAKATAIQAVHRDGQDLPPCAERHAVSRDRRPRLVPTRIRDRDRTGHVESVRFDVKRAARAGGGDAELEAVLAGRGDVDGVVHPLARLVPAKHVAATRIGGGREIDARRPIHPAQVPRRRIGVRDVLSAVVEVLGLQDARYCSRDARERSGSSAGHGGDAQVVEVSHGARVASRVHHDAPDLLARVQRHAGSADRHPRLPPARVRHGHRTGDVHTIRFDVKGPARTGGGHAHVDVVRACRRNVHGVL
jgi:hypothetical protein